MIFLLIVDGYNVLSTAMDGLNNPNLDLEREKLCNILLSCTAFWGYELVVVFDAAKVVGGVEHLDVISPTAKIIYSAEGVSADSVIERLVAEARNRQVIVATSDAAEQSYAFGKGAIRWPARELLKRVRLAQRDMEEKKSSHHHSFKLAEFLPEEIRNQFNTLRLGSVCEERQTKQSVSKRKRGTSPRSL